MVFSSNIFLFLFLPLYLGLYYLTPLKWRSLTIIIGSYAFYAWWRVDFLALFAGVTLWNYVLSKLIVGKDEEQSRSKRWMLVGVAGNLFTLALFKYFNFGVDSLNALLGRSAENTIDALTFILPIGISFYIFQSISFLIDVYRRDAPPARNFLDFAAFISLFPQLIAGPVLRYKDLAGQFQSRTHSFDLFSRGAYRFMIGFTKKVLIADTVAGLVDSTFALSEPTMAEAWLGALAYAIQLYFDFSAYSDMAIGLGMMMGFKFIENFDAPYIARSITEFWRRWHISLSTWLKDYLYIPLGGNRKGKVRTYINLMITMVLGGLWHGANWTFIVWGTWHGVILAIERFFGVKGAPNAAMAIPKRLVLTLGTFIIVVIGWVMFRAENVSTALSFYKAMAGFNGFGITDALAWQISGLSICALIAGYAIVALVPWAETRTGQRLRTSNNALAHFAMIGLFILAVIKLSAQSYSPFLYFQF